MPKRDSDRGRRRDPGHGGAVAGAAAGIGIKDVPGKAPEVRQANRRDLLQA